MLLLRAFLIDHSGSAVIGEGTPSSKCPVPLLLSGHHSVPVVLLVRTL